MSCQHQQRTKPRKSPVKEGNNDKNETCLQTGSRRLRKRSRKYLKKANRRPEQKQRVYTTPTAKMVSAKIEGFIDRERERECVCFFIG